MSPKACLCSRLAADAGVWLSGWMPWCNKTAVTSRAVGSVMARSSKNEMLCTVRILASWGYELRIVATAFLVSSFNSVVWSNSNHSLRERLGFFVGGSMALAKVRCCLGFRVCRWRFWVYLDVNNHTPAKSGTSPWTTSANVSVAWTTKPPSAPALQLRPRLQFSGRQHGPTANNELKNEWPFPVSNMQVAALVIVAKCVATYNVSRRTACNWSCENPHNFKTTVKSYTFNNSNRKYALSIPST